MITKKILSVALACSMLLAMSAQAFAVDIDTSKDGTLAGAATVEVPTVKVTAPASLDYTLDPLNIGQKGQVHPTGAADDSVLIENLSAVPVDLLAVSAVGLKDSKAVNLELVATAPLATETKKQVNLFVRAMKAPAGVTAASVEGLKAIKDDAVRKYTAAGPTKAGDILVTEVAPPTEAVPNLLFSFAQGVLDGSDYKASPDGKALIYMGGAATAKAEKPWIADDKVAVTLTLKLAPKPAVPVVPAP